MKRFKFLVFVIILSSSIYSQEDLKLRVQQLENQIKQLTSEVTQLREIVRTQQKLLDTTSEKINKQKESPYDEIIEELKEDISREEGALHYLKVINSHVQIGGYAELVLDGKEGEDITFEFPRLALQLRSSLTDWLVFRSEILIEDEDEIDISYAHLTLDIHPLINFKAGVILVPFGHYNKFYFPPSRELTSIPLVDQHVIPTIWSDPGISVFGKLDGVGGWAIEYEVLVSNGLGEGGFTPDGNQNALQGFRRDNNGDKQWAGRLGLIPDVDLQILAIYLGLSGVIGEFDDNGDNQYAAFALDGNIKIGEFTLIGDHDYIEFLGEYSRFNIERDNRIESLFPDIVTAMDGFYIQANYHFFPETWRESGLFAFGSESSFALLVRYESIDLDTTVSGVSQLDDQKIYTLGFNFRPIKKIAFKIEYNRIREFINGDKDWSNRFLASFATYF